MYSSTFVTDEYIWHLFSPAIITTVDLCTPPCFDSNFPVFLHCMQWYSSAWSFESELLVDGLTSGLSGLREPDVLLVSFFDVLPFPLAGDFGCFFSGSLPEFKALKSFLYCWTWLLVSSLRQKDPWIPPFSPFRCLMPLYVGIKRLKREIIWEFLKASSFLTDIELMIAITEPL